MVINFITVKLVIPNGESFSSSTYTELDCSIFRFKGLKYQSFDKSMGEGEIIVDTTPPDEWNYPKPNSTFEYMFKNICEKHQ